MWQKRLPAYTYLKSDGNHPVPPSGSQVYTEDQIMDNWYNQTTLVDGLTQETCRDMVHTTMGLSAAINMAETAWHQGLDLYKEGHNRIVKAMEFHADYILGAKVPEWLCHGKLTGGTIPMWEIGYNHYHNRDKEYMPKSEEMIMKKVRHAGNEISQVWETLTHAENPNNY